MDIEESIQSTLPSAEAKTARLWITDMFTRVHTTCEVPVDAVFGPCELKHTSVYDSIAFIALKCMDRRTAPFIIKHVDTSVDILSTDVPVWLRLVQSARCLEEQNLAAYVKNGQLFYRALRRIERDEELMVWYSKDLAKILHLLNPQLAQRKDTPPYTCVHCNQQFESEFPFLAHQRFLCTQRRHSPSGLKDYTPPASKDYKSHDGKPDSTSSFKRSAPEDGKPGTDFHNLARDIEQRTGFPEGPEKTLKRKRVKVEEEVVDEDKSNRDLHSSAIKVECFSNKESYAPSFMKKSDPTPKLTSSTQSTSSIALKLAAFSTNFSLCLAPAPVPASAPASPPASAPTLTPAPTLASSSALPMTSLLLRTCPTSPPFSGHAQRFHPLYGTTLFQNHTLLPQIQALPSPNIQLSPSSSPIRLQAQNWCARCSLTFRLTSDLVAHMRTHHQGALANHNKTQSPSKQVGHSCPICREVFQQRHHLARHLAAHTRSNSF